MHLGRVAGTLVASRKEALMSGMKFLVVRQLDSDNRETGSYVVAVDAVGIGRQPMDPGCAAKRQGQGQGKFSIAAAAAGAAGMVGGQMIDIAPERAELDLQGITNLQALKTGALITFSCEAGAILGDAEPRARQALAGYARDLGLAFQIVDDLLDSQSTPEELGKPTGQDAAAGKATLVSLLGIDGARERAQALVERVNARLDPFADKAELLRQAARYIVDRRQ